MVLLAAGIFDSNGKMLFMRAFVELTRSRLEGLVQDFAKLCLSGREDSQLTYTETDSVRYVYLPMDELYMVSITSKLSDIIEDMEVNRLFVTLVNKICTSVTEDDIFECRFDIINAFDEVISYKGRKEKVNLEQIKCFVEMESHEKIYEMEVAEKKRKALEIRKQKEYEIKQNNMMKRAGTMGSMSSSSMGSMGSMSNATPFSQPAMEAPVKQTPVQQAPVRKGLVLGKKVENAFMEQIAKEDKALVEKPKPQAAPVQQEIRQESIGEFCPPTPSRIEVEHKPVHIAITEHLSTVVNNEGSVKSYEVTGELAVTLASVDYSNVNIEFGDIKSGFQLKTHPKVDKSKFAKKVIASSSGTFPVNSNISLLRWKGDMKTDKELPLNVSCWSSYSPNELSLTISCETEQSDNLYDIGVAIPTPATPSSLNTATGEADYIENNGIVWSFPQFEDASATLDAVIDVDEDLTSSCFPLSVNFGSKSTISGITISNCSIDGSQVEFSVENRVVVDNFIVEEN